MAPPFRNACAYFDLARGGMNSVAIVPIIRKKVKPNAATIFLDTSRRSLQAFVLPTEEIRPIKLSTIPANIIFDLLGVQ